MRKIAFLIFFLLNVIFSFSQIDSPAFVDSLRHVLQKAKDTNRVLTLDELAVNYAFFKPDSGFYYAKEGLQLAEKLQYKKGIATSFARLAAYFRTTGSSASAMQYARKALPLFEELKDTDGIAISNLMMNWVYFDQEENDSAFAYVKKATLIVANTHSDIIYWCYTSFMQLYNRINKLDSAIYFAQKADSVQHDVYPVQMLGEIYAKKSDTAKAIAYYKEALGLRESDMYRADIAQLEGDNDSAAYYAKKRLADATQRNYLQDVNKAAALLFIIYSSQHKSDSALKYNLISQRAQDSLFSKEKARQFQTAVFSETLLQQEVMSQQQKNDSQHKIYTLLAIAVIILLVAFFLYRSNREKLNANRMLQQQKEKVESTLKELKSTQQQLIQSEKMASLGELTAGIAHEIQNPLNFVNNFSEVNNELIEELKAESETLNAEQQDLLNNIFQNNEKISMHGKRADAIVKGMLQHSRQTKGVKEPTDINALCDEYLKLSYHGLRAKDKSFNADFKTDFDASIGKINIVPQDIGRVLLNIINNAFYAMNEKKKLLANSYQPTAEVKTRRLNDKVEILVRDNGNGIPQNIIDKIFQPFFTTKPTGQGTGLGLSLAYDIITKEHNGTIKVESKEGEGTAFILTI